MKWDAVTDRTSSERVEEKKWHHNYCRNPNGSKDRHWCLVTPETFQFCDIPICEAPTPEATGMHMDFFQCADEENARNFDRLFEKFVAIFTSSSSLKCGKYRS